MEDKLDEEEIPERKINSVKLDDFFSNYEDVEEIMIEQSDQNNQRQSDINKDINIEKTNLKNSLYKSIYAPTITSDKNQEKPKVTLQRKNNLLNFKRSNSNINDDLSYIEPVRLFIDDTNKKLSEVIIQNYECKFIFDENIEREFINLVHFSSKYFEFPIFYVYKGTYDESSHITTITLKDYRSFKIFSSNNKIYKKLAEPISNKSDFYKYAQFYKISQDKKNIKYETNGWKIYDPICEYLRQEVVFSDTQFCFSNLNNNYQLCETYPNVIVIPTKFNKKNLFQIAKSRIKNRFPLLSFHYHRKNKISSYLYRSAQIKKGGIIFKDENLEIEYMNHITNIENNNNGFIIFDCRPKLNAKVNAFKGAGVEEIKDYKNCRELFFGCIENIHCVRESLKTAMRKAYYGNQNVVEGKITFDVKYLNMSNFLSKFESSKWLNYLSDLLLGSILVSKILRSNINVLVHCSDGWDRTSQVCSLVQIILDPFFRTIEGFAVLVEKEWISFGHQFATRNGCDTNKDKIKERSPIFIQFLHAVYQITMQYPTAFEFNNYFLLFLSEEIYSNKYGTFLFNCEKEKIMNKAETSMVSIWSDIFYEKNKYLNDLYKPINGILNIKGEVQYLTIWNDFFFKYDKVGMALEEGIYIDKERYINNIGEEKTKSIIELLKIIKNSGQEELMKDNKIYKLYKDQLDKDS